MNMKTRLDNEVLDFIARRFRSNCNWLDGNCYYFAVILKSRFPDSILWYDLIYGHFFVNINGIDYDWTGLFNRKDDGYYIEWENLKDYDSNIYERVIRDCIL